MTELRLRCLNLVSLGGDITHHLSAFQSACCRTRRSRSIVIFSAIRALSFSSCSVLTNGSSKSSAKSNKSVLKNVRSTKN